MQPGARARLLKKAFQILTGMGVGSGFTVINSGDPENQRNLLSLRSSMQTVLRGDPRLLLPSLRHGGESTQICKKHS